MTKQVSPSKFVALSVSYWPFIIAFILLVVLFFLPSLNKPDVIDHRTPMLYADSSKSFSIKEVARHNDILREKQQADLTTDVTVLTTQENTRTQTRMFFVTILAAIVTYLISDKGRSLAAKPVKTWPAQSLLMFLIVSVYGLEVHHDYLNQRSLDTYHIRSKSVEALLDLEPNNTVWYVARYDSLAKQDSLANANRWKEKTYRAFHPSLDHKIFYISPLILVLAFFVYGRFCKKS